MDSPFFVSGENMKEQSKPSKSKTLLYLLFGFAGFLVLLCCVGFLVINFFGGQIIGNSVSKGGYGQTADQFMKSMSQGDIEQAFQHLSSNGQKIVSKTNLEEMANQNWFSGYQRLEIRSLNQGYFCDVPQPENTISIGGRIHYDTDMKNDFFFVLEQEANNWKIYCMKFGNLGIP